MKELLIVAVEMGSLGIAHFTSKEIIRPIQADPLRQAPAQVR